MYTNRTKRNTKNTTFATLQCTGRKNIKIGMLNKKLMLSIKTKNTLPFGKNNNCWHFLSPLYSVLGVKSLNQKIFHMKINEPSSMRKHFSKMRLWFMTSKI